MSSACTDRKLQSILCALQGSGIVGSGIRYEELVDNISNNPNYILASGSQSYTITILQGTIDVHGTTLPEGSWTFSAPSGGSFGAVTIDATNSTNAYVQALYPQ